jgi:hypothetical protein
MLGLGELLTEPRQGQGGEKQTEISQRDVVVAGDEEQVGGPMMYSSSRL